MHDISTMIIFLKHVLLFILVQHIKPSKFEITNEIFDELPDRGAKHVLVFTRQ